MILRLTSNIHTEHVAADILARLDDEFPPDIQALMAKLIPPMPREDFVKESLRFEMTPDVCEALDAQAIRANDTLITPCDPGEPRGMSFRGIPINIVTV